MDIGSWHLVQYVGLGPNEPEFRAIGGDAHAFCPDGRSDRHADRYSRHPGHRSGHAAGWFPCRIPGTASIGQRSHHFRGT